MWTLKMNFLLKRMRYLQEKEQRGHGKGASPDSQFCWHILGLPTKAPCNPSLLNYAPYQLLFQPSQEINKKDAWVGPQVLSSPAKQKGATEWRILITSQIFIFWNCNGNMGYVFQYVFILTIWTKFLSANWVRIQPAENYFHSPETAFSLSLYIFQSKALFWCCHINEYVFTVHKGSE